MVAHRRNRTHPDIGELEVKEVTAGELSLNQMPWRREKSNPETVLLLTREWLVTNGVGGFASSSVSGECTRRYHGLLVANFPPPLGRVVMLSHFREELQLPD